MQTAAGCDSQANKGNLNKPWTPRAGGDGAWCRRWGRSSPRPRAGTATRPRSSSTAAAFTFNELEAQSNAFANGLVAAGIAPGDTVTLYGPNSWQWMVAYYAIAKTGAVVNPVNAMLTPEEVKYIVEDSRRARRRRLRRQGRPR